MPSLPRAPQRITPAFAFSFVDRAVREGLTLRQFGRPEMNKVVRFFYTNQEPECVYCGNNEVRRWDHLVPVMKGGDTVLGNMVLACAACDDSKQASEFEQWMNGDAPLSPRTRGVVDIKGRVERIRDYVRYYGYNAQDIDQRLNKNERDELQDIRQQIGEARRRLDLLVSSYRTRLGH